MSKKTTTTFFKHPLKKKQIKEIFIINEWKKFINFGLLVPVHNLSIRITKKQIVRLNFHNAQLADSSAISK